MVAFSIGQGLHGWALGGLWRSDKTNNTYIHYIFILRCYIFVNTYQMFSREGVHNFHHILKGVHSQKPGIG